MYKNHLCKYLLCKSLLFVAAICLGSPCAAIAAQQERQPSSDQGASEAAANAENLDLRHAEIMEKIAEINVRKALESNERVAGTVPDAEVQRRQQILKLARRDAASLRKSGGQAGDERLREATARLEVAEGELRKAHGANRRAVESVPDLEVQRLELEVEAARINVARAKAAAEVPTALSEVRRQVQELRAEIASLRRQVAQLSGASETPEAETGQRAK